MIKVFQGGCWHAHLRRSKNFHVQRQLLCITTSNNAAAPVPPSFPAPRSYVPLSHVPLACKMED